MKKNFPITILLLLLLASSALFLKSTFVMKESSQGFTMFYFEKTEHLTMKSEEDIKEKLIFSINNKKENITYEITHFINDQEVLKEEIEAKSNEITNIIPPEKLVSEIMKITENSFTYKMKTNKSKEDFELTKKLSFK